MQKLLLLLTVILLWPLSSFAEEDDWDFSMPHKNRCSEGGQKQMNDCLWDEYKNVDSRLNSGYRKLTNVLADITYLKKAQKSWLQFRDYTCEYQSSGIGKEGSLYPSAQAACLIDLTEKRIRDIDRYLEWSCNGCPIRK